MSSSGTAGRLRRIAPVLVGALFLVAWEAGVRAAAIPPYILPGPLLVARTLVADWSVLGPSLLATLKVTGLALLLAVTAALALAMLFAQWRWVEASLYPYAVILQVTPIVSIAPLILIWVDDVTASLLICAAIVAFFPVLSNATAGLNAADRGLQDLMRLYGATRWQALVFLRLPAALPYVLAGLRISGGLALIGAVVAEFVAGAAGTQTGLAYRILESGYRLNIPRMFAALALVSLAGIAIFLALSALSAWILRPWHESAERPEA